MAMSGASMRLFLPVFPYTSEIGPAWMEATHTFPSPAFFATSVAESDSLRTSIMSTLFSLFALSTLFALFALLKH